ncbi:Protein CL16A [Rhizophlyctis rosea]|nr:Protein CL16A [Rhizophlyctis rosea]
MDWFKGLVNSGSFTTPGPSIDSPDIDKRSVQYLSAIAQKLRKTLSGHTPSSSGSSLLSPLSSGAGTSGPTNLGTSPLVGNTTTGDQTRQKREKKETMVKCLRELVEILIWADNNNDSDVFELHLLLLKILNVAAEDDIVLELLRFYNVFFESVQAGSILYFFLSNNHINDVIGFKYNTKNEEILSYYMTLLKNLSLKMNPKTANLFYNEVSANRARYCAIRRGFIRE